MKSNIGEHKGAVQMTDQEVLKLAFGRALEAGWSSEHPIAFLKMDGHWEMTFLDWGYYRSLIFSHPFAKAFWKEDTQSKMILNPFGTIKMTNAWRYHLMWMAYEPNPIDYLRKFVGEEGKG